MTKFLDEVLAYVELGEADRARLVGLHDVLEPQFSEIADRFYVAVWANPGAAAMLSGPEQVERLRRTLIDWMSTGLRGPYDDAFHDKRSRIGRRHVQIGLAQHYMFTAISVVRDAYHVHIAAGLPSDEARLASRAVDKLLDVELALMLRHYQLDSEDKLVAREREIQTDRIAAMQTLSAGLAHEVRNPLNSAKLQLELLERRLRRGGNDPKLVEPVELAHHEIQRLTVLLNEFLSFARPPELHAQPRDVVAIVRHVIELERPSAEQRGAELALVGDPAPTIAPVDPAKLHQIVQNLVRNAIEAVSASGHITVAIEPRDGHVHIRVADDGHGIPENVLPHIFEPFFSTKEGGTGMGMAIVHSLVALHGGTIDVTSTPRGTTLDVALPRPTG